MRYYSSYLNLLVTTKRLLVTLYLTAISTFLFSQPQLNFPNTYRVYVTADFSFDNNNTCSGTIIQFTANPQGGTAPYTYLWNFGDGTPTSNTDNPTHSFTALGCTSTTFSVRLVITDAGGSQATIIKPVVVKQIPDVGVKDQNFPFNPFSNCNNNPTLTNPNYTITVGNNSPNASCIISYAINWGDGQSQNNISFPITHTYTQLGAYNLVITAIGSNGCSNSKTYVVANQSNPGVTFGTVPNTTLNRCAPADIPLVISNWQGNSPGTIYVLNFGDGTPSLTLTHPLANDTVVHIYTNSSCPSTSYTVTLNVINACSNTPYSAGNIQVRIKPKSSFTFPDAVCTGSSNCFTNTSNPGSSGSSCVNQTIYNWDFGDGTATSNIYSPCHIYTTAGTYIAKLSASNGCGTDSITKTICVRTPPTAAFTMDKREGCAPDTVNITNTSPFGTCGGETYGWQIAHTDVQNCGTSSGAAFIGGTGPSTRDAKIRFTMPGRYVITLTETATATSCTPAIFRDTFYVKAKPRITLSNLTAVCVGNPVFPVATVSNCYSSQTPAYNWTFTNGTPATATTLNPGPVLFGAIGTYPVTLSAENECGITTATTNATITNVPTVNAGPDSSTCSGVPIRIGVSTGTYTYSWSPTTGLSNPNIASPTLNFTYTGPNADTLLTYILTASGGTNCSNKDTVQVRVKRKPVVVVSPTSAAICAGSSTTLVASGAAGGYTWTPATGLNVTNRDTVVTSPTAPSTTYTVTGTENGCTATAQVTVTVTVLIIPNAGPDTIACTGSTAIQLTGTPAGGTWNGSPYLTPGGIFNPNAAGVGVFKLYYTAGTGICISRDSVLVSVITNPTANASADSVLCQAPGTIQLIGQPTGGSWSGSTLITTGGVFTTNTPGTYTLIYRIGGGSCVARDTVIVTVNGGITNNLISANQSICPGGQPMLINGQVISGGNGAPQYQWQSSTDSLSWLNVPGATQQNFLPAAGATQTLWYRRLAFTSLCSGPQTNASLPVKVTINPNAVAQFNPTTTIGCVPFAITPAIINLTPYNNAVSTYNWYVNGAFIGNGQAFPGYTMNIPGDSITIKLVAISRFGCKNDSTQYGFKTIPRPIPAFTQSDSVGCGPLNITFTNQTPNAAQYNYLWVFGTGQTSSLQQPGPINFPPNLLSGDTVYTVRFITISQCSRDTMLRYVRVKAKPKALFAPDRTNGCSSYNFTFTNTSRGNGNSYVWDFGDGSPTQATNAATVQHIYHTGITDTFRVKLIATNECGTDSLVYKLVVQPISIRPDFAINGNERYGCLPHTVRFFNNSQGGSAFTWDFGDGGTLNTSQNVDTVTHTFLQPGTYTVKMRATNTCSDTTDTELITVYPKPTVAFTANPLVACFGDTIRLVNGSDTGMVFNWRFGDGGTSLLRNPTHVYGSGGAYRIWLKGVKAYPSGVGCADSAFADVLIRDTLPGLFTASDTVAGCVPAVIIFKNSNRPAALTTWAFGDGGTATGDSVGHTYLQAGTYTVKMISNGIAGCTYTFSKTITISSPAGTLQYTNGYLCPGIPLQMQVTVNSATQQIRYVFGDGDSLTTTATQVSHTYLQPGVYVPYAYVIAGSCMNRLTRSDTVKVDRLRTGFRTQQQQQCSATIVTFTDTSNAYFGIQSRRYDFGDGTFSVQANPVKTYLQSGTYNVRLRITGMSGCVDTVTIPVVVSVRNYPVSSIGGDSLACIGQPVAFTGLVQSTDAVASYNWTFGNGVTGIGATTTATYNQPGMYSIRLISRTAFGCADTVYKTIRVSPSPIVNVGPDVGICRGNSIQLSATGAAAWQWSPLQNLSCVTCSNPVASPLFTTSYVVTGSNNTLCKASDTIIVEVIQPFNLTVSPTTTLCIGDSVQLFATGAYTYAWNPPVSLDNPALSNPIAKPTLTTVYQVVGRDRYNCFTDTDYVRVNVGRYPTVDLGTGGIVTAGTVINMNPVITNGPIISYRWTPVTDLSCSNCPRPTAIINKDITYKLEVANNFGCTGSDTIIYKVNCDPNQLFIPNAFSPDGDGTNDVLMVRGKGIATVKYFRIFNRWGQLVFERSNINANDLQQGWDGKVNGVLAQPDVYVYTAEAVCTGGSTFVYKGNVTLVR